MKSILHTTTIKKLELRSLKMADGLVKKEPQKPPTKHESSYGPESTSTLKQEMTLFLASSWHGRENHEL